nr:NSP4 [Bat RVJ-like rotavirus BtSY3]
MEAVTYIEDKFDSFVDALNISINSTIEHVTIEAIQTYFASNGPQFLMVQVLLTLISMLGIKLTDVARRKVTYFIQMIYWKFKGEVEHIARREMPDINNIAAQIDSKIEKLAERIGNLEYLCNEVGAKPRGDENSDNFERCMMMYQMIKTELESKFASVDRRLQDHDWRITASIAKKIKDEEIVIVNKNEIIGEKHNSVHVVADDVSDFDIIN